MVAVTRGILEILDERELRGVLAHELSHVANRDILIGSIAAAIGMSITFLARFALWFGVGRRPQRDRHRRAAAGLGPRPDRGRDHPDGREPLARVPGRRVGCDPVARPRRAGERAPQARERCRQGPGARVGEPRRGPPVHREPVPRPSGVDEPGEPVLDAPARRPSASRGSSRSSRRSPSPFGRTRPAGQTWSSSDRRSCSTSRSPAVLTPSAGAASSRRIRNDRMPSASAPSQYQAWSSTKTASSGPRAERVERGPVDPGVRLGHAHLEREHDRVRLVLQSEVVDDRAGGMVAVAHDRGSEPAGAELAQGRDRVVPHDGRRCRRRP